MANLKKKKKQTNKKPIVYLVGALEEKDQQVTKTWPESVSPKLRLSLLGSLTLAFTCSTLRKDSWYGRRLEKLQVIEDTAIDGFILILGAEEVLVGFKQVGDFSFIFKKFILQ